MTERKFELNASQLGAKGEARFREICEDAKLICNKSERDLAGWDFYVALPFVPVANKHTTLDSRKVPISCHVQVKTLRAHNDTIRMRLSAAEWLAKDPKPTFIFVLKVDDRLEFTDAFLIHLYGAPLAKVLRRLRLEEANGTRSPNRKTISFSANREGAPIGVSGAALKVALEAHSGTDLSKYISGKAEQLAKLGFEGRPFAVTMSLHLNSKSDLIDAVLGLRKDIRATDIEATLTRFGIQLPLPDHSDSEGIINFHPTASDTCTITARAAALTSPAVFRGSVFLPALPGLLPDETKAVFRTEFFSVHVVRTSLNVVPESASHQGTQTPSQWANYWRFCLIMSGGRGTIEIQTDSNPLKLRFDIHPTNTPFDVKRGEHCLRLSEELSEILKRAGVATEPAISMQPILEQSPNIQMLRVLLHPELQSPELSVSVAPDSPLPSGEFDMTFVGYLPLGSLTLGYSAVATMSRNGSGRVSKNLTLKSMCVIHPFPDSYERFVADEVKATGHQNYYAFPVENHARFVAVPLGAQTGDLGHGT